MKNYKEIYEKVINNIDNEKIKKQEIEIALINLQGKKINISSKEMELLVEIDELKEERKNVANQKTKPIMITANTILTLLLVGAIYLEYSILSTIATIGKKILAGIGLFMGFGEIYMCALIGILLGRDIIIKKIQNKNKDNQRYIELTERLKEKNKELTNIREEKQSITEEIIKNENEIQEIDNQIELSTQELEKIREEIIRFVTNQDTEIMTQITETQTKPYRRIKTKEN